MVNAKRLKEAVGHTETLAVVLIQTLEKFQVLYQNMKQDLEEAQDMDMVHGLERIMARDQAKVLELKQGLEGIELFYRLPQWFLGPVLTLVPGKSLELKHALQQISAEIRVEAMELRQAVEDMWAQAQAQNLSSDTILEQKKIVGCMEAKMESPERILGQILGGL